MSVRTKPNLATDAPERELVERVTKAIYDGNAYLPLRQAEQAARAAIEACGIESLLADKARLVEVLDYFLCLEREIKIEIGAVHRGRMAMMSGFDLERDASFRRELEVAFNKARAALTRSEP